MTAAATYAARIDAVRAQRARLHGAPPPNDPWAGPIAQRFRADPHRQLDANLAVLASYIRPEDILLDVGGGAGRVALPLALRCREVIVVDASPGMGAEFTAGAAAAGIINARFVHANWLEAAGLQGDVALTSNVTYFVREIVPFVEKLASAAQRRVMITVWSVANPNQNAALFRLVYGEEPVDVPGYRELLPVLWEMDILPEVHVLPGVPQVPGGNMGARLPQKPEDAVQLALQGQWLGPQEHVRARRLIEERFSELFAPSPEGFRPLWRQQAREMLITWETNQKRG
ncbi:MAG TPA: methyltransferase domain-containing protein [Candidatus Binatia bacterium]|nr:methyltransferase domain-containing protein [Candidatus Binatia bacterium]